MKINPLTAKDGYKADHRNQYPEGTEEVFSNFTARSAKFAQVLPDFDNKVMFFGLQFMIKDYLIDTWNDGFFNKPKDQVVSAYKRRMDNYLGKDAVDVSHIEALHDLGYLPLKLKALPEGRRVPIGVPCLTVKNTLPEFFWLTNFIETAISAYMWKPITNATVAFEYKRLLVGYAKKTGSPLEGVQFQAHDFSMRGMSGIQDAAISGAAHLTSFVGTDCIASIDLVEDYYYGDVENELIGASVPATEHSVMCMGEMDNEVGTFKRLMTKTYPAGIVSIVSDTWDFWNVITKTLPTLKAEIMARDGKVVIRPDSGDPVKIICGDPDAEFGSPENFGAVQLLWDTFGGTITETGHKLLDSHIGLIYGDSITLERASQILDQLDKAGFASANVVFGIGAFTYQYNTRDTFGFAMKATSGVVNGVRRDIFKAPKTDAKKTSAKGLLSVRMTEDGEYYSLDGQSEEQETYGELQAVFEDGKLYSPVGFNLIRGRVNEELLKLA